MIPMTCSKVLKVKHDGVLQNPGHGATFPTDNVSLEMAMEHGGRDLDGCSKFRTDPLGKKVRIYLEMQK